MGIGRREFLRLTSLAITGLTFDPLQAVLTPSNLYINKKLGIMFRKPNSWGFVNIKDFGKLKDEQILGNGWNEMKEEVWEDLGDPICIITKYPNDDPEFKGVFSPTISVQITPKEDLNELWIYNNFDDLLKLSEIAVTETLRDFKVIKRYDPYFICDSKFYEFDTEYLFEHVDLKKPIKVELKVLKTEYNGFYYDFNLHQSSNQNQQAESEFRQFIKSIKLI